MTAKTLDQLTLDDFLPLKDQPVTLRAADAELPTILREVTAMSDRPTPAGRLPFSLVLHGPASPRFPQGHYHLMHPDLGAPLLFTVCIGPPPGEPEAMRYQVIIA